MNEQKVLDAMADAERKAWEALSGYKFWMFGYHAGRWVNYNALLSRRLPNPFRSAVTLARQELEEDEDKAMSQREFRLVELESGEREASE